MGINFALFIRQSSAARISAGSRPNIFAFECGNKSHTCFLGDSSRDHIRNGLRRTQLRESEYPGQSRYVGKYQEIADSPNHREETAQMADALDDLRAVKVERLNWRPA
jgi:hypothetical protein